MRMLRSSPLYSIMLASAVAYAMANDDGEPMGVIELDESLSDAEKPPELSPGVYQGEVQDVQISTSAKGNQYFAIKFVIPPDELPADFKDSYPDGAILYWNRNVVPTKGDRRAAYNLKRLVEALGLDTNTTTIDPNEWMGRNARLRVRTGKYQGEERAEIASVEAAEAAAPARSAKAENGKGGNKRRGR